MLSYLKQETLQILVFENPFTFQYLILILITQIWLGLRIQMLWEEFLKKALRIISFQWRNCHSSSLFSKFKVLKFNDKVLLENALLMGKFINCLLPPVFNDWFTFCSNIHNYETTSSATCKLFKLSFRTNLYRKNSITINAIDAWN